MTEKVFTSDGVEVPVTMLEEMKQHNKILQFQARPNIEPVLKPIDPAGFKIDTSKWNMGMYRVFFKALNQNNIEVINQMLLEVVYAWPFEYPLTIEGFDQLMPKEWAAVARAVGESANKNFQE